MRSLLLPFLCACGPAGTSPDGDPSPEPFVHHSLDCSFPTEWDPSDPLAGTRDDILVVTFGSDVVLDDDDAVEQCITQTGGADGSGGWVQCAARFAELGYTAESFAAAMDAAYGEPLTPAQPVLDDLVQRCLVPQAPFEPDARIELANGGWFFALYGLFQAACPTSEPGTWGADQPGTLWFSVDPVIPGCSDDLATRGWSITTIEDSDLPVATVPGLTLEVVLRASWDTLEAAR